MRYLLQAVIIAAVTFAAELIKYFVPLPVPASIYGLLLLFALLKSGLLKLEQIEDVGNLLLELMPLLLVPADAGNTGVFRFSAVPLFPCAFCRNGTGNLSTSPFPV